MEKDNIDDPNDGMKPPPSKRAKGPAKTRTKKKAKRKFKLPSASDVVVENSATTSSSSTTVAAKATGKRASYARSASADNSSQKKVKRTKRGRKGGAAAAAAAAKSTSDVAAVTNVSTNESSLSSVLKGYADESDPETSLNAPPLEELNMKDNSNDISTALATTTPSTINWDPNSPHGEKVGQRIRIYNTHKERYDTGRVTRYDPISHKHKVLIFNQHTLKNQDSTEEKGRHKWFLLQDEHIQLGGEFVWALVKGYPWWPAQILHCLPSAPPPGLESNKEVAKLLTSNPVREGYVLVEFFHSDDTSEVARVKNHPDHLRPFRMGQVDKVITKLKKKRNVQAIAVGQQEEEETRRVRRLAARFYAVKAFDLVNYKARGFLGQKVQVFRSDLNYPTGETLVGIVRNYSISTKKWLVSYDVVGCNKGKDYEPTWLNLLAKDYKYKLLDKGATAIVPATRGKGGKGGSRNNPRKNSKKYEPNDEDLIPFTFGMDSEELNEDDLKCRASVEKIKSNEAYLQCFKCSGTFLPKCIDPPMSQRQIDNILKDNQPWTCSKCKVCVGCREQDIAFGVRTISPIPTSLHMEPGTTLELCSKCIPLYEQKGYCPICSHTWDEQRYLKVQERMKWAQKQKEKKRNAICPIASPDDVGDTSDAIVPLEGASEAAMNDESSMPSSIDPVLQIKLDNEESLRKDANFNWTSSATRDNSWFTSESDVWGFNEGTMLECDSCKLWVHAGCAELSKKEYDLTTEGKHDIYSKDFLCRTCCKQRCEKLVESLKKYDKDMTFACPVTDQVAPGYSDIIKNPMDLQTMTERAALGQYRNYAWLRETFELMIYNALIYNRANTKYWKEARQLYATSLNEIFEIDGKGAPPSKYAAMIQECYDKAERDVQAEKDRVKTDETVEKKDLVAGAQVLAVNLGPLSTPKDKPSCVRLSEVTLKPVDAFYCSWMDACAVCGSSGASDTMLSCVDCGEAFHSFCASAPIHSMNEAAIDGWRCPNCKVCEISGEAPEDELKLLYCEMCDRAFSLDLLEPPLTSAPSGLWICGQCVDCTKCDNRIDNGEIKRTYWSRDPQKCLPCGGCNGLSLKSLKNSTCKVCHKISREPEELLQCSTCSKYVHTKCDERAEEIGKQLKEWESAEKDVKVEEGKETKLPPKYSCKRCRQRERRKKERKEEKLLRLKLKAEAKKAAAKEKSTLKKNKEKKIKSETAGGKPKKDKSKEKTVVKKAKHVPTEKEKEEALVSAMNDAKARGLPDGWTVSYGYANRKRWRSPPPHSRMFDSIPKALQFVEDLKSGKASQPKTPKKEKVPKVLKNNVMKLQLNEQDKWTQRTPIDGDNKQTILRDAEILHHIVQEKFGKKMQYVRMFDSAQTRKDIDLRTLSMAKRYARYVKRAVRKRRADSLLKYQRGSDSSKIVMSKMAAAFISVICILSNTKLEDEVDYWKEVVYLLAPPDDCGEITLLTRKTSKFGIIDDMLQKEVANCVTKALEQSTLSYHCETNVSYAPAVVAQCPPMVSNSVDNQTDESHNTDENSRQQGAKALLELFASSPDNKRSNPMQEEKSTSASKQLNFDTPMNDSVGLNEEEVKELRLQATARFEDLDRETGLSKLASNPAKSAVEAMNDGQMVQNTMGIESPAKPKVFVPGNSQLFDINNKIGAQSQKNLVQCQVPAKIIETEMIAAEPIASNRVDNPMNEIQLKEKEASFRNEEKVLHNAIDMKVNENQENNTKNLEIEKNSSIDFVDNVSEREVSPIEESTVQQKILFGSQQPKTEEAPHNSGTKIVFNENDGVEQQPPSECNDTLTYDQGHRVEGANVKEMSSQPESNELELELELLQKEKKPDETEVLDMSNTLVNKVVSNNDDGTNKIEDENQAVAVKQNSDIAALASEEDTTRIENVADKITNESNSILKPDLPGSQGIPNMTASAPQEDTEKIENVPEKIQPNESNSVVKPDLPGSQGTSDMTTPAPPENTDKIENVPDKIQTNESQSTDDLKNATNVTEKNDLPRIELPWHSKPSSKVKPMLGWGGSTNTSDAIKPWVDSRTCALCGMCGDEDSGFHFEPENEEETGERNMSCRAGRLLPASNGQWVHTLCAIWSSEVWEDVNGGVLNGVQKAISRGLKLKCTGCGRPGATLGCHKANCHANYHLPCAIKSGVVFTSQHKLFCSLHTSASKNAPRYKFSEHMKTLIVLKDEIPPPSLESNVCYRIGTLVVHSLGTIEQDNDGFHSEYYITPPGYTSTRIFWSFVKPKSRTLYVMKIGRSAKNNALFSIVAADAPTEPFQGNDVSEVFSKVLKKVDKTNEKNFATRDDMFSILPMVRTAAERKRGFCLNGPQFFGFGIDTIRKLLETSTGAVACAVPLSKSSIPYKFCFVNPKQEEVMDLQRKRAANLAEKALENASGCARTEGMSAVDKSSGSGRITRALVSRTKEGEGSRSSGNSRGGEGGSNTKNASIGGEKIGSALESKNQAKYMEMKSVPLDQRLAAKRSHIHGWGLFAKIDIPKHAMIAEYMGETIRQCVADKREKAYEASGAGSCYMFRLDMKHIVDATEIGCMARFMNHCCAANAYAKIITVNLETGLEKKIVVFANQDIFAGDEITYDYKFPVEDGSLRCTCGAPNCIGRLN